MTAVLHPTAPELQTLINTEQRPLLLNFSATWCGPCRASAPHVEAFAAKHQDVVVAKVDVDENPDVAARFLVRAVPTFIVLRDGQVTGVHAGAAGGAQLERLLSA